MKDYSFKWKRISNQNQIEPLRISTEKISARTGTHLSNSDINWNSTKKQIFERLTYPLNIQILGMIYQ